MSESASEVDADMEMDDDNEQEMAAKGDNNDADIDLEDANVDVDEGVEFDADEDEDDDQGLDPEEEEDDPADSDVSTPSSPPAHPQPRLKIKLRLPQAPSPNFGARASTSVSTPSAIAEGSIGSHPHSRRAVSRDIDIESEDEDDEHDLDADDQEADADAAGGSEKPMTARQAVLASVVGSSHVSLSETSRKKRELNETELALRREETARKRKNMSEKKLEDEKAETINRLLKKQSKSKHKRNALSTADDRTPLTVTPALPSSARDGSQEPDVEASPPVQAVPVMYRWISTTREITSLSSQGTPSAILGSLNPQSDDQGAKMTTERQGHMQLSFSIPVSALTTIAAGPERSKPIVQTTERGERDGADLPTCNVPGCPERRKYRLVHDWMRGACGIRHLNMLEQQLVVGSAQ